MSRYKSWIPIWCVCVLLPTRIQAQTQGEKSVLVNSTGRAPTIAVTARNMDDKTLKVTYEIRNGTGQDIWLCEDISTTLLEHDFEAYMAEDRQTLLIRRRLDVPPLDNVPVPPFGRYVRLRDGQVRTESLILLLPVESRFFWVFPSVLGEACAKSLALEFGYYPGDLPGKIRGILEEAGKSRHVARRVEPHSPAEIKVWFGGLSRFIWWNWPDRLVGHRGEEVIIAWTGRTRLGEQVLGTRIDGLSIPYEEKYDRPRISRPDLSRCTRLEVRYEPSVLDYFFPYPHERGLLDAQETQHLRAVQTIVVDDPWCIAALAGDVGERGLIGGIVVEGTTAHVVGYRDGARLTSFTICGDRAIVTEDQQCIRYSIGLPSLKSLTPPIRPFQLRVECADHLQNLWSLLRLWYADKRTYPASKWCTAITREHGDDDVPLECKIECLRCPTAGPGKSHYAMNPKCRPNSPPDMVLLFETKAGWNQHGGPEVFRFDNHDPRGGLVLLNDGTVKFIRTEEELKQLRWK